MNAGDDAPRPGFFGGLYAWTMAQAAKPAAPILRNSRRSIFTTGPTSTNPRTGKPYNLQFPVIMVRDMVRAQQLLLDHLGIERLLTVIGGSMGAIDPRNFFSGDDVRDVIHALAAVFFGYKDTEQAQLSHLLHGV